MRSVLSSQLHRVALGVGILILAIGISLLARPSQRNQDTGSVLSANESVELGGGGDVLSLSALISAVERLQGSVTVVSSGATVGDSVTHEVIPAGRPESHGGPGDVASVQDRAHLVVRDAEGNVKHRETIK